MIILLNEDWRIKSDSHNWILQERRVREKAKNPEDVGTEYWRTHAYCGSLDIALLKCAEFMVRFSDAIVGADDIEPLLKRLDALAELLRTEKAA